MSIVSTLLTINNISTFLVGIISNLVLLGLCCFTRFLVIESYQGIIIFQSIHALLVTIVYSAIALTPHYKDGSTVATVIGPSVLLPDAGSALLVYFYQFLLLVEALTLHIGFGSRYAQIFRYHWLGKVYRDAHIPLIYLIVVSLCILTELVNIPSMEFLRIEDVEELGKFGDIILIFRKKENLWRLNVFAAVFTLGVLVSYAIAAFTSIWTLYELRDQKLTETSRYLEMRCVVMIIIQTVLALGLMVIPVFFYFLAVSFRVSLGFFGVICQELIHWQPCAHSVLALIFLRPYKKEVRDFGELKRKISINVQRKLSRITVHSFRNP